MAGVQCAISSHGDCTWGLVQLPTCSGDCQCLRQLTKGCQAQPATCRGLDEDDKTSVGILCSLMYHS